MQHILFLLTFLFSLVAQAGAYTYQNVDFVNNSTGLIERNWIKNSGAEVNTTGWAAYADTPNPSQPPLPIDGTGGAPTVTCTRTTSTPLNGAGSLLITKDAANRQGEGCSYAFTIDNAEQGKVQTISFNYSPASGTYSGGTSSTDSDLEVYIYDVTNGGTPIQPAGYKLNGSVNGSYYKSAQVTFQTASNSTSYRLIFHVATTSASAYTMKLDEIKVGPQYKSNGPPVTDWVAYTPTGAWVANSTYTGYWRRVGDQMEVSTKVALSGAPTAAAATFTLPSGYTIDTAKMAPGTATTTVVGECNIDDTSSNSNIGCRVYYASTTSVGIAYIRLSGSVYDYPAVNATTPVTFANGDSISATFKVPISGWSSSVLMSSDADTRVVALELSGTSTSVTSSVVDIVPTTVVNDTHGGMSSATYTVKVPGVYQIEATLRSASVAWTVGHSFFVYYSHNGGADVELGFQYAHATITTVLGASGSTVKYLNAGDTIKFRAYAAVTGTPGAFRAGLFRLSGPSQIAASETVAARYTVSASTANTSFADDVAEIVDADTKVFDTHGAVTTGAAWKFTVPVAGKYRACIRQRWANGTNLADTDGFIYKNGSIYAGAFGSPTASVYDHNGCVTVSTVSGDYLQWYANQNDSAAGARNIATTGNSFIDIYRIGN